jgi:hypothetical protein
MATAAAIAAAAATAISAGVGAASAAGAFTPGVDKPRFEQVPKRPFETAQQKYMTRVMLSNLNNRGPTYQDWLRSGGTAHFELQGTNLMSPKEARQLGFVGPGGRAPAYVDPAVAAQQGLTPEQYIYSGVEKPKGKGRAAALGRVQRRIEKLQGLQEAGGLRPGQERRLERLGTRKERILAKGFHGQGREPTY